MEVVGATTAARAPPVNEGQEACRRAGGARAVCGGGGARTRVLWRAVSDAGPSGGWGSRLVLGLRIWDACMAHAAAHARRTPRHGRGGLRAGRWRRAAAARAAVLRAALVGRGVCELRRARDEHG